MAVKKLGELLVESGLITEEQLKEALKEARTHKGRRLGTVLINKGYATDIDIAQTLAYQLKIPYVELSNTTVDPEAIKLVDEKLARKHLIIPIYIDRRVLGLAMADPLNLTAIDDVRFATGMDVKPCVVTLTDVTEAINRHYHLNEPLEELMADLKKDSLVEVIHDVDSNGNVSELVRRSAAPPIIKMVDSIIINAVDDRASDIHIEPQDRIVNLRLRVDGIMKETMQFPKWVHGPVVSRIKIMAKMDIAERRIAQDGRMKVRLGDKNIDIRVSTLPTQYGETVVMRLLDPGAAILDLDRIGLSDRDTEVLIDIIERPQGVVIVTGPTGSGKTSTLYAMIQHIKKEEIKIITIEDPIEYELKGVNQVAVNEKTGLTFAFTLRSVLRQDPDVILVGEMRDSETATIAHQASLTGHLVFSSLHTNDAVSSVTRLRNMGVPSYVIASALNGIVAQRLVRKICRHCKKQYTPSAREIERAGVRDLKGVKLYRGAGCQHCKGTGYSGRIGIFEIVNVTSRLKTMIANDAPEHELRRAAIETGTIPMHRDGINKVLAGLTTLDELARVIYLGHDTDTPDGVCPWCFGSLPQNAEVCPHCSKPVSRLCPSCKSPSKSDWIICPYCAHWLRGKKKRLA